jgi:hypothetical protein
MVKTQTEKVAESKSPDSTRNFLDDNVLSNQNEDMHTSGGNPSVISHTGIYHWDHSVYYLLLSFVGRQWLTWLNHDCGHSAPKTCRACYQHFRFEASSKPIQFHVSMLVMFAFLPIPSDRHYLYVI